MPTDPDDAELAAASATLAQLDQTKRTMEARAAGAIAQAVTARYPDAASVGFTWDWDHSRPAFGYDITDAAGGQLYENDDDEFVRLLDGLARYLTVDPRSLQRDERSLMISIQDLARAGRTADQPEEHPDAD